MSLAPIGEMQAIVAAGRAAAYEALVERRTQVTLTLAPLACLALLDALEGTAGYSRLIREATADRMTAVADRLEQAALALQIMARGQ